MFITNKNIAESLVRSLQHSFTNQTNCEITLMCEGKSIKCHRHVLVLHSAHFTELFKDQANFPTAVAVVNMKYTHLKAIVDYMYFGRIKLQEDSEEMQQIIKCAGDLGLTALVNFISEYLKNYSKMKVNQMNGVKSTNEMNGDGDSIVKRKRASEPTGRVLNDSFKKPKLNEAPLNQSTPLRDNKSINKSNTSDIKTVNSSDSESLSNDKKRKSDDDEADDEESKNKRAKEEDEKKRKAKEAEEAKKKLRQEEENRRREEEEAKRKAEEKQRIEEERRRKAEEERQKAEEAKRKAAEEAKRKAAEEAKRKAEEEERIKLEEEKKRKEAEKKKEEEELAKKAEEEKKQKEHTKCDESSSTKSCAVCNKQYKDNIDHRKVLDGVVFEKKCIMSNCSKPLKFRRSLIDHLLKEHKIDVCDG